MGRDVDDHLEQSERQRTAFTHVVAGSAVERGVGPELGSNPTPAAS
jgi:hypothetical protein